MAFPDTIRPGDDDLFQSEPAGTCFAGANSRNGNRGQRALPPQPLPRRIKGRLGQHFRLVRAAKDKHLDSITRLREPLLQEPEGEGFVD